MIQERAPASFTLAYVYITRKAQTRLTNNNLQQNLGHAQNI